MTRPPDSTNEGSSSILRAVGSLLVALSGGDDSAAQRLLGDLRQDADPGRATRDSRPDPRPAPRDEDYRAPAPRSAYQPPAAYPPAYPLPAYEPPPRPAFEPMPGTASGDVRGEVEFILSDARARAQRILDDSMERARDLVRHERVSFTGFDPGAFDDLRRSIHGLVTEVRDIQQRLGRIEALLRAPSERTPSELTEPSQPAPRPASPAYEPAYEAPASEPPVYAPMYRPVPERQPEPPPHEPPPTLYQSPAVGTEAPDFPAWPSVASPEPEPYASQSPQAAIPPPSVPSPAPAPPRSSFSVVPPERRDWVEPDDLDADPPVAPAPPVRVGGGPAYAAEPAWQEQPQASSSVPAGADIATFLPEDGAITLRVTPVAGFQGLMRVQDALARLPAVRSAAVEAYSQGEARLRVELEVTTDSEELAAGLSRSLKEPAQVREVSESARQLLIALR